MLVQAHQEHGGDGTICLLGDVLLLQSADVLELLEVEDLQSDEKLPSPRHSPTHLRYVGGCSDVLPLNSENRSR